MLIKVTFKPWDEVVIHESMHYSLEDIVKLVSFGVQPEDSLNRYNGLME